jgi:outer membrane protein OmpA-like peptidoglycan-associated protein
MKKTLILSILSLIIYTSQAQSKKQLMSKAEYTFYGENFAEALVLYAQLEAEHPKETDHLYYKYIAELLTTHRGQSMDKLLALEEIHGKHDKFYNYWLGRVHLSRYELDLARERFQGFLDIDAYKSEIIVKEVKDILKNIRTAEKYYNDPDEYEIEPLPLYVNSSYNEITPAFFSGHNELLFASDRTIDMMGLATTDYNIYHAEKINNKWSTPTKVAVFGTTTFENAKIEMIDKDKRLYTFRPEDGGNLLYSEYTDNSWGTLKEFDAKIKNKHIESHFFINDSEDLILFISQAKKDKEIWETRLVNGNWTEPGPIKGPINSTYDEESPFISHDGTTLYFSSNRPESMGGFDVFKSEFDYNTNAWQKPVNMGFPINTLDDEINFEVTPSDQSGFIASNRLHSNGGYDIYYFHIIDKILIKGIVKDATGKPLAGAEIKFHPKVYEDEAFIATTNSDGSYQTLIINKESFTVEVLLHQTSIHKEDYTSYIPTDSPNLFLDVNVNVPPGLKKHKNFATIFEGEKANSSTNIEMMGSKFRTGNKVILNNIYFDFQSYSIKPESELVLQRLLASMQSNPNLNIEIAGHTDNVGSAESNLELSKKRAESVKKYLTKQGISADRMKTTGYGEAYPLASNDDEENGRELNRRIEITSFE